jgi:preprotein translocase subunit YajC
MNGLSSVGTWVFPTIAQTGTPSGGGAGPMGFMISMLPLVAIVVIMYFLMIRPQQKKQKAHMAMMDALKQGDEVVTSGGIYGIVAGVKKNTLYLKVAEGVKIEIERFAIARVLTDQERATKE